MGTWQMPSTRLNLDTTTFRKQLARERVATTKNRVLGLYKIDIACHESGFTITPFSTGTKLKNSTFKGSVGVNRSCTT